MPITVDCVVFGFDENELKVLLIRSDLEIYKDKWSLLGDFADVAGEAEDLDAAAYRILKHRTGMDDVFLEQVKPSATQTGTPAAGSSQSPIALCSILNITSLR